MTIEQGIQTFLTGSPYPLAVENRVYSHKAPQGGPEPYIVFWRITPGPRITHTGAPGLIEWSFQFSTFGKSQSAVLAIGDALRRLLHGYSGTMGSVKVRSVIWQTSIWRFNEASGMHGFAQDFRIQFVEQ